MDPRRLIDLELAEFKAELGRREGTLDLRQADRMKLWLAGWEQAYREAYDIEPEIGGQEITQADCERRLNDMQAYVDDRREKEDFGTAEVYARWLEAFRETYALASGESVMVAGAEVKAPEPDVLTPEKFAAMHHKTQIKRANELPGERVSTAKAARAKFAAWHQQGMAAMPQPMVEGADLNG